MGPLRLQLATQRAGALCREACCRHPCNVQGCRGPSWTARWGPPRQRGGGRHRAEGIRVRSSGAGDPNGPPCVVAESRRRDRGGPVAPTSRLHRPWSHGVAAISGGGQAGDGDDGGGRCAGGGGLWGPVSATAPAIAACTRRRRICDGAPGPNCSRSDRRRAGPASQARRSRGGALGGRDRPLFRKGAEHTRWFGPSFSNCADSIPSVGLSRFARRCSRDVGGGQNRNGHEHIPGETRGWLAGKAARTASRNPWCKQKSQGFLLLHAEILGTVRPGEGGPI